MKTLASFKREIAGKTVVCTKVEFKGVAGQTPTAAQSSVIGKPAVVIVKSTELQLDRGGTISHMAMPKASEYERTEKGFILTCGAQRRHYEIVENNNAD